jgi:cbb3-type cytochrome oxidase subunit 1
VVSGMIIMAYNCYKTIAASKAKNEASDVDLALEVAK